MHPEKRRPPSPGGDLIAVYPVDMSITLFATVVAKPGSEASLAVAVREIVEAASEEEGLLTYRAHEEDTAPGTFWFYEVYADADALAVHGRGPLMRAALGALSDHVTGPPEVHQVTAVAAKG